MEKGHNIESSATPISVKKKAVMQITDAAADRISYLLSQREKAALGIRIGVKEGGCSGLSYTFEYCDEQGPYDEVVEHAAFKVFIDPKAIMYIIGTTLDFKDEEVQSGFVFINPNETGRCGCGTSFSVR